MHFAARRRLPLLAKRQHRNGACLRWDSRCIRSQFIDAMLSQMRHNFVFRRLTERGGIPSCYRFQVQDGSSPYWQNDSIVMGHVYGGIPVASAASLLVQCFTMHHDIVFRRLTERGGMPPCYRFQVQQRN